jgi:hypothetical protein
MNDLGLSSVFQLILASLSPALNCKRSPLYELNLNQRLQSLMLALYLSQNSSDLVPRMIHLLIADQRSATLKTKYLSRVRLHRFKPGGGMAALIWSVGFTLT